MTQSYYPIALDLNGKPWDPSRSQIWWNESQKKWLGNDVPDFKADSSPKDHMGPFIMNAEGVGRLLRPAQRSTSLNSSARRQMISIADKRFTFSVS